MADNAVLNAGSGGITLATDDIAGVHYQIVKISFGALDTATPASSANPLPVVQTGTHTVTGAGGSFPVTDSGGSLTVDNPQLSVVGSGTEAAALRVTIATDSTGVLSVDDNGGNLSIDDGGNSITVDGTVAVSTVTTVTAVTAISNALPAGTNNIGDVDVLTVPTDPFGANADAASATGSISAKLRFIAGTGIPITGTVTVGSHAVTNAGTFVTQENGGALTSLQLIDDTIIADDAAFTVAVTKVGVAGYIADETATDSVDEGDAGAARMTLDRKLISTIYAHAAAGGATPYKNLDVDESEDDIKTSAGKLYWLHVVNLAATKRYLKIYNLAAASVSVGTTVPDLTFPIPTMGDTNGAGFTINFGAMGLQFTTAICIAATTGFADNDAGAPGANEVILNAGFL